MAVYSYSQSYAACLPFVRFFFRCSYRRLRYRGLERVPKDAAIIYTPNHCNALMDALAILFLGSQYKVFVARADIFRRPRLAAILRWLRIMPIRRVRDGWDEVRRNDDTIRESVETLSHGVPFCIMVEGTHHAERSILPLKKGAFRIAIQAAEGLGEQKPLYIVPVRLEFADLYHLWDTLEVTVGEPLPVEPFSDTPAPVRINHLLEQLTDRMNDQLRHCGPLPREDKSPLRAVLLALPALLCAAMTLPIWLGELIIRHTVEDECFHTSVLFVWQMIWFILSLGILILPWIILQEFRYQIRK